MLVSDLLHSCANHCVAEAAVHSIGGTFASTVEAEAADRGMSIGLYTAKIVREFAMAANERDWRDLVATMRGQDHPVLAGLQMIVARRAGTLTPVGCESSVRLEIHPAFASAAAAA